MAIRGAVFQWDNGVAHNLVIVGQSDYNNCTTTGPGAQVLAGGSTGLKKGSYKYKVTASPGTVLFFICTVAGHCQANMKVNVLVT